MTKMNLILSIFQLVCAYFLAIGMFSLVCSVASLVGRMTGISMNSYRSHHSHAPSFYDVFLFVSSITMMCTSYAVSYHIVAFITSAF